MNVIHIYLNIYITFNLTDVTKAALLESATAGLFVLADFV